MARYTIGLDYGTLSVRAILVAIATGEQVATSVYEYPHGVMETRIPTGRQLPPGWALQDPQDYIEGLITTIRDVMSQKEIMPEEVIGVGIDFTSATILPVKIENKMPLCMLEEFKDEPHAYVKLWKHHGAEEEAKMITEIAKERGEKFLDIYGGKVSSEMTIPKILETLRHAPKVYEEADRFMEAMDWIVWQMTGEESKSACGAGYKMFYNDKLGYPSKEFFKALDPKMEDVVKEKLDAPILPVGSCAGRLTESMAKVTGLLAGTPVGTGIIDAHSSVPGGGVAEPGTMMIIVGTSSCHMFLADQEKTGIEGIQGVVKDGIVPGYYGYEAGQSCVGDHYAWFVKNCVPASYMQEARDRGMDIHALLADKLKDYKAGQSGLVALDWFNGVRSPLQDYDLNGLIVGFNLLTKPEEIYLSLIEATAFGTRMIIEGFEDAGMHVDNIVLSGGIPMKNKMLVQVYSDICNRNIRISGASNASAMGAAYCGIAAAPESVTGYKDFADVVKRLGKIEEKVYTPNPENVEAYDKLYEEYKTLSDYFGRGANDVMKRLNAMRAERKGLK